MIRVSNPDVGKEEIDALTRVINKAYLGMSTEVQLFENELKAFFNKTDYEIVCVNTGTSALHLALEACGIKEGDEVLVPSITYVATFQAVLATGAKPVACDICIETGFIDSNDVKRRITSRTKAIIPVHYGSNTNGISDIYELALKNNLCVVEDAAHSFGNDNLVNDALLESHIICLSFDGIKNITCGDGGAVLTNNKYIAEYIKDTRLLGVEKDTEKRFSHKRSWTFDVKHKGFRYHMNDISACIGREQLKKFHNFSNKRRSIAKRYVDFLKDIQGIQILSADYEKITPHIFPIRVLNGKRDELKEFLEKNNIQTGLHYYPNHRLTKFKTSYELLKVEQFFSEILSIPLHTKLLDNEVSFICEKIETFVETHLKGSTFCQPDSL
ncbi:MAG: DegT/DnrJ/EryC1/StrS family aminotransferase [Alphaproteobacteria bacterium]